MVCRTYVIFILLVFVLLSRLLMCVCADRLAIPPASNGRIIYTRSSLLDLRPGSPSPKPKDYNEFPKDLLPRKRGKRGGVRKRVRSRRINPPLPTILFGNVRSLANKMDELNASTRYLHEFRESCLMCFSETWLNDQIPDSNIELPNFDIVRGDRTPESGKSKGGGLCLYINRRWCNNWSVKKKVCTPDYEILTVGLRPFYLPREFNQIFITVTYIQPKADVQVASDAISLIIQELETVSPDSAKFILGDFNQCRLNKVLPSYHQYVDKPTRNGATLDLCYGNVQSAYKTRICPQLGNSDHNTILLLPTYRQVLKRSKPVTKVKQLWSSESVEKLRACFDCTNWDSFTDTSNSID